ncbi:MAG: helix-hairpin-helix domain-containing protein [Butyricicoccaceae bacterium]
MLYYTIRQGDTNPVAHALMQHSGSLHAVLEATAEQLCEVEGVGPRTAEYLSLISKRAPLSGRPHPGTEQRGLAEQPG